MFITCACYEAVESYEQPTIAHTTHFYSKKLMYRFNSSTAGVYNFKNGKGRKIQMILIVDADDLGNILYQRTILFYFDGHDYQGIVKKRGTISDFVIQRCTYRDEDGFQVGALKGAFRNWYCAIVFTLVYVVVVVELYSLAKHVLKHQIIKNLYDYVRNVLDLDLQLSKTQR